MEERIWVIVVAAGSGSRFGSAVPKQFLELTDGLCVLDHTVLRLRRALPHACIVTVLSADNVGSAPWPNPVAGGATRSESVGNALRAIDSQARDTDIVLIHDGARPVVGAEMVKRVLGAVCAGADAVVPGLPMTDSMVETLPDGSVRCVDRGNYRRVQTPQAFRMKVLREAYAKMAQEHTSFSDDLSAVLHYTRAKAVVVEGDIRNIKITHRGDLETAAGLLEEKC